MYAGEGASAPSACDGLLERLARVLPEDAEHDALEAGLASNVPADLLDFDAGRLAHGKSAHARSERDQAKGPRAELVRHRERARCRGPDGVGRRGTAQVHRRGMDDPACRQLARARGHRLAQPDRGQSVALLLNRLAAGPGDGPGDPAAVPEVGVRRVGDRVDVELRYVGLLNLDVRHRLRGVLEADHELAGIVRIDLDGDGGTRLKLAEHRRRYHLGVVHLALVPVDVHRQVELDLGLIVDVLAGRLKHVDRAWASTPSFASRSAVA